MQLLANCDVAVQNMRPGVMDSLGMGYEHAAAVNPDIIYCSMSGYGPTGPYAGRAAYDPIIQAVAGYVALQVNPEVPIPDLVRNGLVDKASGWMAALAIVSALFARSRGATGQHIDLSMLDTAVQFLWPDGAMADTLLDDDAREGRANPRMKSRLSWSAWLDRPERDGIGHPAGLRRGAGGADSNSDGDLARRLEGRRRRA